MNVYLRKDGQDVLDYVTQTTTSTSTSSAYVFGVSFTPKINCSITKVKFLGGENGSTGTLYIMQGTYISESGTTYSITTSNSLGGEYTLTTPYQLTANTYYCIGFKFSGIGTNFSLNNGMSGLYPVEGTNITFRYGTYSGSSSQRTGHAYCISGLYTQ